MKMSHLYFDKYCTRTVQFENAPGLFHFNGEAIPRNDDKISKHIIQTSLYITQDNDEVMMSSVSAVPAKHTASKYKNKTTMKHVSLHPEEKDELRAKEVAKLKHIYHDNNFVRIHKEQRALIATSNRVWLPSEKQLKFTASSQCGVVETCKPQNTKLGLSKLRVYGGGQDKPHHIPVAKNVERLKLTL